MPLSLDTDLVLHDTAREVELVIKTNPLASGDDGILVDWQRALIGGTVRDYIPKKLQERLDTHVELNGQIVPRERWSCRYVDAGDQILVGPRPEGLGTILLIGALVLSLASPFIARALIKPEDRDQDNESPSYGSPSFKTTADPDRTVPIIVGDFIAPGNVILATSRHKAGGAIQRKNQNYSQSAGLFRNAITVALCEGPIESIDGYTADVDFLHLPTNKPTGPSNLLYTGTAIRVNRSPFADFGGEGFASIRLGGAYQDHLPFQENRIKEVEKAVELNYAQQFTYETTEAVVGFVIVIYFPSGMAHIPNSGKNAGQREKQNIQIKVEYRPKGSSTWETTTFTEWLRFDDPSAWSLRVDLPEKPQVAANSIGFRDVPTEIRVTRTWPDLNLNPQMQGTIVWQTTKELIADEAPTYAGTALVGLDFSVASAQGQFSSFTCRLRGRKMFCMDPDDLTKPWVEQYSTNPADVLCMLATSRVGLRDDVTLENLDLPSIALWKKDCATQIPDGKGGFIPKWEFNGSIDDEKDFETWAGIIAAAGGARAIWVGSKLKIKMEKADDPVQRFCLFGMGNIKEGSFAIEYPSAEESPDFVDVEFRDRENDFGKDVISAPDDRTDVAGGSMGRREAYNGIGWTHRVHAKNGATLIHRLLNRSSAIRFTSGLESIRCEPGDVIPVMHQLPSWGGISGRLIVDAPGSVSIKLEQDVEIPTLVGQPFKIMVWTTATGSDVLQLRRITAQPGFYAAGTTLTISPNWDGGDHPKGGDVYCAGLGLSLDDPPDKGPYRLYKVASVRARESFEREIRAVNYDPTDYDLPFTPAPPPPRPRVLNPWDIPPPVMGLNVKQVGATAESMMVTTAGGLGRVRVSWTNPRWLMPFRCRIYGRIDTLNENTMHFLGLSEEFGEVFDISNLVPGWKYTVAVVPASNDGMHYLSYDDEKTQRTPFTVERPGLGPPPLYPD